MRQTMTLTGTAVGDSLGMPFEKFRHDDPELMSWDGGFRPCPDSHPFCRGLRPGQWTDDTKMSIALAESMVSARTYSPADAAKSYVVWYRSKDWRGIGGATKAALDSLDKGRSMWMRSGTPGAEGNGTAMRIAPLGVYLRAEPGRVIAECSRLDAGITHDSLEAREGAVIIALAVAFLANAGPKDGLIEAVAMGGEVRPSRTLGRLKDVAYYVGQMDGARPETAVAIAANVLKTGGHVVETVPAAIFCFLATSSFAEAVDLAVRAGGDTDTTAAIAGALAGTFYPTEQLQPYLGQLEGADRLPALDDALLAGP